MEKKIEITTDDLIAHFEGTLGLPGATALITRILKQSRLNGKDEFDATEMATICGQLALEKGFIATTAHILLARTRLRSWKGRADQLLESVSDDREADLVARKRHYDTTPN